MSVINTTTTTGRDVTGHEPGRAWRFEPVRPEARPSADDLDEAAFRKTLTGEDR